MGESPALKARLRELTDEATEGITIALGGPKADCYVRLAAGMIVLTVQTAREEAFRLVIRGASARKASLGFLGIMNQGLSVIEQLPQIAALAAPRTRDLP